MSDRVLVILTNWKRPANLPLCIKAWREQSLEPASIVVMDNSPYGSSGQAMRDEGMLKELYPQQGLARVDDVWRVGDNCGPLCRLWPALALAPKYDYILFADDDFLPGKNGLLAAVQAAKFTCDKFATIGQQGRTFNMVLGHVVGQKTIWSYKFGDVPRLTDGPQVVDCTVRCHLVLTKYLYRTLHLREKLSDDLRDSHDDLLLCLGLQIDPGFPSYILLASTLDRQLIVENLPGCNGPEAAWKRPDHLTQRSRFINLAAQAGWNSFVK